MRAHIQVYSHAHVHTKRVWSIVCSLQGASSLSLSEAILQSNFEHKELEKDGHLQIVLCRLWLDSASYSGQSKSAPDSVIVFLWNFVKQNSEFKTRRIITVLRKRDACKRCGCGGRCSTDRIKEIINWDFSEKAIDNFQLGITPSCS